MICWSYVSSSVEIGHWLFLIDVPRKYEIMLAHDPMVFWQGFWLRSYIGNYVVRRKDVK